MKNLSKIKKIINNSVTRYLIKPVNYKILFFRKSDEEKSILKIEKIRDIEKKKNYL